MDLREKVLRLFYKEILGREADSAGLDFYMNDDFPLELVYLTMYDSEEAVQRREKIRRAKEIEERSIKLPITLSIFVKDCEDSIHLPINSVKPIVKEIVVLDTGSKDNTVKRAKELGANVYKCGFTNFGDIRTTCARLSQQPYVFMLDGDESIIKEDLPKFKSIIERMESEDIDIVYLPRKRWEDLEMSTQVEEWAYPDLQARLFKNKPEIKFIRRVHECISGSDKKIEELDGPCIQHFQDVFKTGEKLKERNEHYKELYKKDIEEGIEHKERVVQEIDER